MDAIKLFLCLAIAATVIDLMEGSHDVENEVQLAQCKYKGKLIRNC